MSNWRSKVRRRSGRLKNGAPDFQTWTQGVHLKTHQLFWAWGGHIVKLSHGGWYGGHTHYRFRQSAFCKEKRIWASSVAQANSVGCLSDLAAVPWVNRVKYHFSSQGQYTDFNRILKAYCNDWHVYVCGPNRYMEGVIEAALAEGFPQDAIYFEYFSKPEIHQ